MTWTERSKFSMLMLLHLLWGCVLWFSISKYGLGVSTDSVDVLFGGFNLSEGRGLVSYDGSFVMLWPPLYSMLLAFVHRLTGLDMLAAAGVLQFAAFLGLSWCLSIMFTRIFPGNFLLAAAATALSDVGTVVLSSFNMVGADYLHLFLAILFIVLTASYIGSNSPRVFVALAVVGMLATLDRYLGVAVVVTGAVIVVWMTRGTAWQRIGRGAFLLLSVVPAAVWLAATSRLYARRAPISLLENFNWFSKSILQWFFEPDVLKPHLELHIVLLWIIIMASIVVVAWSSHRANADPDPSPAARAVGDPAPRLFVIPLLLFGPSYAVSLFGSASIAYFNKLGGRFLLPLYIPFVALLAVTAGALLRRAGKSRSTGIRVGVWVACYSALALTGTLLLQVTLPLVLESHTGGAAGGENVYNTKAWRTNPAVQYWLSHVPSGAYQLLSNDPDGVAFNTWHVVRAVPRKTTGPYGTAEYPLNGYAADLFAPSTEAYILWIEPNPYPYSYTVQDLSTIAQVEPLLTSAQGGVYRMTPKPGS